MKKLMKLSVQLENIAQRLTIVVIVYFAILMAIALSLLMIFPLWTGTQSLHLIIKFCFKRKGEFNTLPFVKL